MQLADVVAGLVIIMQTVAITAGPVASLMLTAAIYTYARLNTSALKFRFTYTL